MARLVDCDEDVMHARTHGVMSSSDLSFFRERSERSMRESGHFRSAYAHESFEAIASFDLAGLRDRVEATNSRDEHRWYNNVIRQLDDLYEIRNASSINRRYLMADSRIRLLHQQGRTDGYGDLYQDEDPLATALEHQANREIITGSYVEENEEHDTWRMCLGTDDENGDQIARFSQREIVRQNRRRAHELLDLGGLDPFSPLGKSL